MDATTTTRDHQMPAPVATRTQVSRIADLHHDDGRIDRNVVIAWATTPQALHDMQTMSMAWRQGIWSESAKVIASQPADGPDMVIVFWLPDPCQCSTPDRHYGRRPCIAEAIKATDNPPRICWGCYSAGHTPKAVSL
jgi:hypothetical protein